MDIHKPKPIHNFREFLSEIGVIVCGVLIALILEQAVEALHWMERVHEAKIAIHQQLALATAFDEERVARGDCADAYLADLATAIVASGPQWMPRSTTLCGHAHGAVYSGLYRPWPTEVWRSIESEGVVSHLGKGYEGGAAFIFDFIKYILEQTIEEDREATQLEPLAYPIILTPDAKISFLKTIGKLRHENYLLALCAAQNRQQIGHLGEAPTDAELKQMRKTIPGFFRRPPTASPHPQP